MPRWSCSSRTEPARAGEGPITTPPPALASDAPPKTVAAASGRTAGYDVARAIALLGMVLVNFHGRAESETALWWPTDLLFTELEGRSAALFVMLAGIGVSLRTRRAREQRGERIASERGFLLRRAVALFVVGLLNLHLWDWDILHVYGLYLTVAALLFAASRWTLVGVWAAVYGLAIALRLMEPEPVDPEIWTPQGMVQSLVFSGNYPALPWLCFLLLGMGLGRLDLRKTPVRRRLMAASGVAVVLAEVAARVAQQLALEQGAAPWVEQWLTTWPRPPGPFFVLSSSAVAVWVTTVAIEWSEWRRHPRAILALTATGQLALSLYVAHEVGILIPLEHDLLWGAPAELILAWGLAFFAASVAGALWWRRRNRQGPLEAVLRQISNRSQPAWGGALMDS